MDIRSYVDDRVAEGVFRVHPDVFTDPELYELEQRHVFAKTWIFLGLDTQLPRPNDYIVAYIGQVQVLVARDKSGQVGAFLNTCRHKGTLLCRTESGNRRYHVCPYHGWSYDAAGKLVDIKDRSAGRYSEAFEREDHDLVRLPAFASYKGLLFGSLSAGVPPLEVFLGDLRFFLDAAMEQGPHGMEFVPGRIAFTFDANWKAQMDNGTDFYHLTSTHTSFMEVQRRRADAASGNQAARQFDWKKRFTQEGGAFTFAYGHNAIWLNQAEVDKRPIFPQIPEVRARAGDTLAEWMLKLRNVTIFPSMQIADATSLNVRTFRPLGVNRTEMRYYCLAPIGEPAEIRAWRLRQFEDFFNVSGFATPDDAVTYEDLQLGLQARQVGWLQGYGRAMTALVPGASPLAHELGVRPTGSVQGGFELQNEVSSHATYREWARLMDRGLRGLPAYGPHA